jgi:hypothetical protein
MTSNLESQSDKLKGLCTRRCFNCVQCKKYYSYAFHNTEKVKINTMFIIHPLKTSRIFAFSSALVNKWDS